MASSVQASLPLGSARGGESEARGPRDGDPAMAKAGRILARRPHSVSELRTKLWAAGIAEDDIDRAVGRLVELKLLDDEEFARQWVDERSRNKGLAGAALLNELSEKGVEAEVAQRAVDEAGLDEEAQARALASKYLRRVAGRPPMVQAQRIQAMLLRRGFSMEASVNGAKAVLPPEGWD